MSTIMVNDILYYKALCNTALYSMSMDPNTVQLCCFVCIVESEIKVIHTCMHVRTHTHIHTYIHGIEYSNKYEDAWAMATLRLCRWSYLSSYLTSYLSPFNLHPTHLWNQ